MVTTYAWIAFGSAIGGVVRYWLSGAVAHPLGETFPFGTLMVNVVGSLIIGFVATLTAPEGRIFMASDTRQFIMFGVCGGFTTFSSFSLQTLTLMQSGEWWRAMGNVLVSVVLCLTAVWVGHVLAANINQLKG